MDQPVTMPDISKTYREQRDTMHQFQLKQKEAYRLQLEKQISENNFKKQREEQNRKTLEIKMLQNYPPFGRRADVASIANPGSLMNSNENIRSHNSDTQSNAGANIASLRDFDTGSREKLLSRSSDNNLNPRREMNSESKLEKSVFNTTMPYDPNKDIKSVFGTTNGQEPYFPFGKPGGGAPIIDSSGHPRTRIEGNLWFHVNGQTPGDRQGRLASYNANNLIKNMAKVEPKNSNKTNSNDENWILEKKQQFLNQLENINDSYRRGGTQQDFRLKKLDYEQQYEMQRGNSGWFNHNFGRPGFGAPTFDTRRHNMLEILESPRDYTVTISPKPGSRQYQLNTNPNFSMPNILYSKVHPVISSSHRNGYDYVPKNVPKY